MSDECPHCGHQVWSYPEHRCLFCALRRDLFIARERIDELSRNGPTEDFGLIEGLEGVPVQCTMREALGLALSAARAEGKAGEVARKELAAAQEYADNYRYLRNTMPYDTDVLCVRNYAHLADANLEPLYDTMLDTAVAAARKAKP